MMPTTRLLKILFLHDACFLAIAHLARRRQVSQLRPHVSLRLLSQTGSQRIIKPSRLFSYQSHTSPYAPVWISTSLGEGIHVSACHVLTDQ